MALEKGAEIVLEIEKFADRGKCISRVDGFVVMVPHVVPGDKVRVRIRKRKKNFAEAILLEVIDPSPLRAEPECRYFGSCGGCKWQHLSYPSQLEAKRESVESALRHHGGLTDVVVPEVIGADQSYGYRNKMEFSFSARRWLTDWEIEGGNTLNREFALGLHVPGQFDKVLDIDDCRLLPEPLMATINDIRSFVTRRGWTPWHIRQHTGYLRHLVLRVGRHASDRMVNIVTSTRSTERMTELAAFLQKEHPEVTTLVNTIHSGVAQTAIGQSTDTIYGPGTLNEKLGPFTFEIGPSTFFQTNTEQAEKLIDVAIRFADLSADDHVYDLYCGCGSISLFAAAAAKSVVGIELVNEAVMSAERNASANGVTNTSFVVGDLLHTFTDEFIAEHGRPDVIIVDPPRVGLHPKVVKRLTRLRVPRLVYVSCNLMSQAVDLQMLTQAYDIAAVQPVDLFPHTHHIENVVKLQIKNR